MASDKRNPGAGNATGASEMDQAAKLTFPEAKPIHTDKQLIGANGRRYSEAILRHWSPAAMKALGIRPADGGAP